ncbi:MAG: cellulase family glycosylhydrolase [Cytophagaceae bacterium]|nr:cellulase family glycosylhydrolase [Cytophagaceae bacterium]
MRFLKNKILLFYTLLLPLAASSQLINLSGKNFFLNGANIAWYNYGWDFGDNAAGFGGGNGYDAVWWENTFTDIESYGGNCVRIWIHCKGEHNPLFDVNGKCSGLNNNFFNNLDNLLQRAEAHNIMVIFCLYDFLVADIGRHDLMTDTSKTKAYINNALIPMVQRYANQCNLIAWEIISEPEWIMNGIPGGGNYAGGPVTITQMQRFVGMCASAIHQYSAKYVTVGSASIRWNASITPAVGNFWSDAALKAAAYNDNNAYLDFYQVHYYDNMGTGLSPYSKTKAAWGFDKPTLVGETGDAGSYTYQQQYDYSYSNGFAGCLMWAYESGGAAAWNDFKDEMKTFRDNNISVVDFDCALLATAHAVEEQNFSMGTLLDEGNAIQINFEKLSGIKNIRLVNVNGVEILSMPVEKETSMIIENTLKSGMYIILLEGEGKVYSRKIVVR